MAYWQDRLMRQQAAITAKNRKAIDKQLRKYYGDAANHVIKEFELTYAKLLRTVEAGKDITPADLYKLDAYWKMQAQIRQELRKLGEKQIAAMTKAFEMQFFDIYYSYALDGGEAFTTIDTAAVQQMIQGIWVADGQSFSNRVWGNTDKLIETLNEGLLRVVATGDKSSDLKAILQERFNVSYNNADTIVRTELAHIQTQAAQKRYEDYGIKEVEVWADEDERRCKVCGKLHQKRYPIGAQMPIPAHPRCRCCVVPVIE